MPIPIQHLPDNIANNNKDNEEQYALLKEIARRSIVDRNPLIINGVEVELVLPSDREDSPTYPLPSSLYCTLEDTDGEFAKWYDGFVRQVEESCKHNPEQEEAERQRLHEWNMEQMEEWSKTKEQKLEEMLAQTTKHVLSYCFNINKERLK